MNKVALLFIARMALACICVLDGRTPFDNRVMMDFGRARSYEVLTLGSFDSRTSTETSRESRTSIVTAPLSRGALFSLSVCPSDLPSAVPSDAAGGACFLWLVDGFELEATRLPLGVAGVELSISANVAWETSLRLAASLFLGGIVGWGGWGDKLFLTAKFSG